MVSVLSSDVAVTAWSHKNSASAAHTVIAHTEFCAWW
jgi:hypothetical protein